MGGAFGQTAARTSREQTHGWNCPYQLTRVPEETVVQAIFLVFLIIRECVISVIVSIEYLSTVYSILLFLLLFLG